MKTSHTKTGLLTWQAVHGRLHALWAHSPYHAPLTSATTAQGETSTSSADPNAGDHTSKRGRCPHPTLYTIYPTNTKPVHYSLNQGHSVQFLFPSFTPDSQ
ncbi:hypothetical protein AMECASPLE_032498 [Ameca splendens]|uniref:Uncharacterized protein n=1 Tax=Ameca splendens TaxID=208324 RepID=A0ABV0Y6W0_9TELE